MKVLLLNPPILYLDPIISNLFFNSPPLGILYIAAVLEQNNIDVKVIDAAVDGLSTVDLIKQIEIYKPDVIGITSTTFSFQSSVALAKQIKKSFNKNIKIIIGGSHISAVPEEVISYNCFDFGIIGEGEYSFLELIQNINKGTNVLNNIKGIIYKNYNDIIIKTHPRPFIENLDILPFPARHLINIKRYKPQPNDNKDTPKLSMISSRGCPYQCIFCGKSVFGISYRSFSEEYIVSEMKYLIENFNAKDIAFVDSLFTISEDRVEKICTKMLKEKIKVSWTCTVRANVINSKNIFKLMKESGCWRVRIGIESGNERISKLIKKDLDIKHLAKVVTWADQAGLQPKGFFMIGHFTETVQTIKESINLAKSLPLKDITLQVNTVLPSTIQMTTYHKYGNLISTNSADSSLFKPIFIPKNLTKEQIEYWFNKFYRSFYLRPVIIWRHIKAIKHMKDIIKYIKSVKLLVFLFFNNKGYKNE